MEYSKPINTLRGYHQKINKIIQSLSLESLEIFLRTETQNFDEAIKSCDKTFLDCAEKKIILAKKKILQDLFDIYPFLRDQQVGVVKNKIKGLISPTENILRDGILGVYSEISELQERKPQKVQMSELLEKIQRNLEPLLRDHFILKQIERMDTKYNSNSLKLILSQKKINISEDSLSSINSQQSINQFLSERALKIIEKQIQCKSIEMLINEQLIGEEKQISQGLQTCRICKNSFKLKQIEKHVDYCSKIQSYSARREEILNQQLEIIDEMRTQITNQPEKINEDESYKIFKFIVESFQKRPNLFRRISAHHHKQRKLSKKISEQIEEYLKDNKNEYIETFKQLGRERQLIEKKISSLENNFLYRKQQEQSQNNSVSICSSKKISRSNKTAKLMNLHTKKSIFARKSESSGDQEEINDQLTKVGNSNEMNSGSEEIDKYQKRQILYKSLSDIKFTEEINKSQVSVKDFEILSFLGKGAFGKVYLVRRKQTKDIYALKVIKILPSWGQKQLNSIKNEHEILSKIAGEHLVKAPFSFTEGFAHFFVFQYMPGGDLGKLIEEQVYLDMKQSQFYLAEIVLAIEHLHNMGIIHRDLKPENIIFDQNCHLKLTDFGLSEFRINDKLKRARKLKFKKSIDEQMERISLPQEKQNGKQRSFLNENKTKIKIVGTPDYIAPQVINGQSLDNLSIDWWSLGVIAYEMMIGCRPFCANTVEQVFKNIQQVNIQWPQIGDEEDMVSPIAADFIQKLLNKDFKERLGAKSISQIKQHPFFEGVDWEEIKYEKPPLIPKLNPKQKYQYSEQMPELRAEIKNEIGNDTKVKSSFKLQNFVRYDILVEETLESAEKQIVKRAVRINRLKSIASNFSNQSIDNKSGILDSGQGLSDEEIGKSWRTIQKII